MNKLDLKGVTIEELREFVLNNGEPKFRASQIFDWLYTSKISNRVEFLPQMINLGKQSIDKFLPLTFITSLQITDEISSDGVIKFNFKTEDDKYFPVVLVNKTLLLSTQIGCNYNCKFCSGGRKGFLRNLTPGEIVDQVVKIQQKCGDVIGKIEFAGMGEPLENYHNVLKAVDILKSKNGLNFNKFSLFTCGIAPLIKELAEVSLHINLVVSLHSAQDEVRSFLMPINKKYSIRKILDAIKYYNFRTGRIVDLDYVLIEGLNDSLADTKLLTHILRGLPVKLRVSSFNYVPRVGFTSPRISWREQFAKILISGNIDAEVVEPFGAEQRAGYGQLRMNQAPEFMDKGKKTDKHSGISFNLKIN